MKFLRRTARYLGIAVLAAIVGLNIWQMAARALLGQELPGLFGYSSLVVMSGSMEPAISAGDLLIIRREATYQEGEVVSFSDNGSYITHRLVGQTDGGFITQGDSNNVPDPDLIHAEQIVGRVVLVIPGLGGALLFLRTPAGILLTGLFVFAAVFLAGPAGRLWERLTGSRR